MFPPRIGYTPDGTAARAAAFCGKPPGPSRKTRADGGKLHATGFVIVLLPAVRDPYGAHLPDDPDGLSSLLPAPAADG